MLSRAIFTITAALVFYTIAVFWERHDGRLASKHMVFFVLGLLCDVTGTLLMEQLVGSWSWGIHSATGMVAITVMLLHTIWAAAVLLRRDEKLLRQFHKISLGVWLLWLIPYLTGMILNMKF